MAKFKVGDVLRCTATSSSDSTTALMHAHVLDGSGVVTSLSNCGDYVRFGGRTSGWNVRRFELVHPARTDRIKPMILSEDPKTRKDTPITTGVLDYFPLAMAAVAQCSKAGNDQHNPGQPLHWAQGKSTDHADCIARHLIDRGTTDTDGIRHSAKLAWRALANLQIELENENAHPHED